MSHVAKRALHGPRRKRTKGSSETHDVDGARVKAKTGKEGRPPTSLGGKDSKNGRRTGGEDRETGKGKQSKQEAVKPPSRLAPLALWRKVWRVTNFSSSLGLRSGLTCLSLAPSPPSWLLPHLRLCLGIRRMENLQRYLPRAVAAPLTKKLQGWIFKYPS